VAEERAKKLQRPSFTQKVFQIDEHVGAVASGYIPDARVIVDRARVFSQYSRLLYDELVDVGSIAKFIGDLAQEFTQFAGVRPFGVSLIIGGVDKKGVSVFLTDPSGSYVEFDAVSIGAGSEQVIRFLEENYRSDMKFEDLAILALRGVAMVSEEGFGPRNIKMAFIDAKTRKIRFLTEEEILRLCEKIGFK